MVPTVKDPSSDIALCARNGSATLRHQREKREKGKMRKRFWELGGSRMGKAMGVADGEGEKGGGVDGRGGGKDGGGGEDVRIYACERVFARVGFEPCRGGGGGVYDI